jgi:hypothetical protein
MGKFFNAVFGAVHARTNVDSLTELGGELAARYQQRIAKIAPLFLGINHEANAIRVLDLLKAVDAPCTASRHPY